VNTSERSHRSGGPLAAVALVLVVGAAVVSMFRSPPRRSAPTAVDAADVAAGYERSDASVRAIAVTGVLLASVVVLVVVGVSALLSTASQKPASVASSAELSDRLAPAPVVPAPARQAEAGADMATYSAAVQKELSEYRWVDRQAGVVGIPIDRAMGLVVQREGPRTAANPTPSVAQPSDSSGGRVAVGTWP
jgi:hypothetical protein